MHSKPNTTNLSENKSLRDWFSRNLIDWSRTIDRQLPWKQSMNPYHIWLSEVILQQTRVQQGIPYYKSFVRAFPDIHSLAAASEDHVMQLWKGLGYYTRARNMLLTARMVSELYDGAFPSDYEELLKLKGIGPYTAAAIASFAFDIPKAVVDGNVYRVLSRYFDIDSPINESIGKKVFQNLADQLILNQEPAEFNQAIMDFGALVCTPANPACGDCYLQEHCVAKKENKIDKRPAKNKSIKRKSRYFNYLVMQDEAHLVMKKRTQRDIWHLLYDFPMVETYSEQSLEFILTNAPISNTFTGSSLTILSDTGYLRQDLTHQRIHARFIGLAWSPDFACNYIPISKRLIPKFAFPKIVDDYIKNSILQVSL